MQQERLWGLGQGLLHPYLSAYLFLALWTAQSFVVLDIWYKTNTLSVKHYCGHCLTMLNKEASTKFSMIRISGFPCLFHFLSSWLVQHICSMWLIFKMEHAMRLIEESSRTITLFWLPQIRIFHWDPWNSLVSIAIQYSAAREGQIPKYLGFLTSESRSPYIAYLVQVQCQWVFQVIIPDSPLC